MRNGDIHTPAETNKQQQKEKGKKEDRKKFQGGREELLEYFTAFFNRILETLKLLKI